MHTQKTLVERTLCAHCTKAVRTGRHVVVVPDRIAPLGRRVVAHGRRFAGPPVTIQNSIVTQKPMPRALRTVLHPHRAVSQHRVSMLSRSALRSCHSTVSQPCCAVSRNQRSPPVTIQKLYRGQEPMSRVHRPCRARTRSYRRQCCVPGHRVMACYCAPLRCLSRYKTLYRDPTPKGAVAHSSFLPFFFLFVSPIRRSQNKLFFFMSSVESNKFIIIYFIFFTCLHTVKPQKKFSSTFFFPPVASLLLLRCSNLNTAIHTTKKF